jgi:uncharacterized membrane protein
MNSGTDTTRERMNSVNARSGQVNSSLRLSLKPPMSGFNRPLFLRSEMGRLLSLSMLFSCLLLLVRIIHTGRITFLFLVWNLFLAWLPWLITEYLSGKECLFREKCLTRTKYLFREAGEPSLAGRGNDAHSGAEPADRTGADLFRSSGFRRLRRRSFFVLAVLAWLFFIPNAFYILTDLYHVGDWYNDRLMPAWYDLIMILSFAWNGLLLGVLSVRRMEKILLPLLPAHNELFFLYPVMWLNALGVYIGRYLRFNTWDVLTNPFQLFGDITRILIHPLNNQYAWDMIFCFSVLMTLIYLMLKKIGHALA